MSATPRLRISGGSRRGLRLLVPSGIRPTSARLREALVDTWADRLRGSSFLDLFAGSGAVGLEAASRGAGQVTLVEGDRRVFGLLERNCEAIGLPGLRRVLARLPEELERSLPAGERFDLVFADPPYGFAAFRPLLEAVEPRLAGTGEVAIEHRWREGAPPAPESLAVMRSRRYGDSGLTLYRRSTCSRASA